MPCRVCAKVVQPMPKSIVYKVGPGEKEPPPGAFATDHEDEVITCSACGKVRVQRRLPPVVHILHMEPYPWPKSTTPGAEGQDDLAERGAGGPTR